MEIIKNVIAGIQSMPAWQIIGIVVSALALGIGLVLPDKK